MSIFLFSVGISEAAWVQDTDPDLIDNDCDGEDGEIERDGGKWQTDLSATNGTHAEAEAKALTWDPGSVYGDWTIYDAKAIKTIRWNWDNNPTSTPTSACFELTWTTESQGSTSCNTDGYWASHEAKAWDFAYTCMNSNIDSTTLKWGTASNSMTELPLKTPQPANNENVPDAEKISDATIDIIAIASGWEPAIAEAASTALKEIAKVFKTDHSVLRSNEGGEVGPDDLQAIQNRRVSKVKSSSPVEGVATHKAKVRIKFGGSSSSTDGNDAYAVASCDAESTTFTLTCTP